MALLAQDERLARTVGTVTLVVVAAAIAFFVFVAGKLEFGERVRVRAYFHTTGGLREGAPVVVGGRTIGTVESIAPVLHGTPSPLGGDDGIVATMALDGDAARATPSGGDVFIAGRGPLSERFLEIGPPAGTETTPPISEIQDVRGSDPPTLDRVLQRTWENLEVTRRFAQEVAPEFQALVAELQKLAPTLDAVTPDIVDAAKLAVQVQGLIDEAKRLRDVTLGGEPGLERIGAVVVRARATLAQARRTIDVLAARGRTLATAIDALRVRTGDRGDRALASLEQAIDRTRAAIAKIDPLLAKLDDINARIARGEGSLLKLANDPEFPEDAKELGKIMKRHPWRVIARPKD